MTLNITFNLPPHLEEKLRAITPDIGADVPETYALELFRRGQITHVELSQLLALDRFETDAYLNRHNVFEGSLSMEDLDADRRTLDRVNSDYRDYRSIGIGCRSSSVGPQRGI